MRLKDSTSLALSPINTGIIENQVRLALNNSYNRQNKEKQESRLNLRFLFFINAITSDALPYFFMSVAVYDFFDNL